MNAEHNGVDGRDKPGHDGGMERWLSFQRPRLTHTHRRKHVVAGLVTAGNRIDVLDVRIDFRILFQWAATRPLHTSHPGF